MNLSALPNSSALLDLYRRYYGEPLQVPDGVDSHVSSHWKYYSQDFKVDIDDQGNVKSLKGAGFGHYQHERLLWRLANYVCCAAHYLRMDNKKEVLRLTKIALALTARIPWGCHYLSYDLFRQIDAVATIRRHFTPRLGERFSAMVIGDGFGFLAALLKSVCPDASLVLVDLGKTLFFQCLYLQTLYPACRHEVVSAVAEQDRIHRQQAADFVYCPAERLEQLQGFRYRLAVNVCSMQEMNNSEIARYFRYLRTHADAEALFYCCNRESKVLPDGEKVEFERYPWMETDRYLVDGHPSVYDFWLSVRLKGNGPRLLGCSVPFLDGPDGPIRHRLTMFSPNNA